MLVSSKVQAQANVYFRHISKLKNRISWLESIIRERCPDVDLSLQAGYDPDRSVQDFETSIAESATEVETQLEDDNIIRNPALANSQANVGQLLGGPNESAHEIGMVSLGANQDPRYIGRSSGYFLARVMLPKSNSESSAAPEHRNNDDITTELVEALQGPLPLPPRNTADKICNAYFGMIHLQYPILHQPTFLKMLDSMYAGEVDSAVISFQVYMVLAIGTSAHTKSGFG